MDSRLKKGIRRSWWMFLLYGLSAIVFGVVLLALVGLGLWYFRLQVLEHEDYATRSEANRIKPRPVVPGRGLIYDRKGRILADNVAAWRLEAVPERAGDGAKLLASLDDVIALDDEQKANLDVSVGEVKGLLEACKQIDGSLAK